MRKTNRTKKFRILLFATLLIAIISLSVFAFTHEYGAGRVYYQTLFQFL